MISVSICLSDDMWQRRWTTTVSCLQ